MFRTHRHVRAKSNEWIHVHRSRNGSSNHDKVVRVVAATVGGVIGVVVVYHLVVWIWGLFVLAIPFLIVAGVVTGIVLIFKKKS